ncbi:MAG: amidohydrolase family protein [Anaerolineae bacterium]|nr:amidohydrolase family protein [Anaerolineae bacterium]
MIIDCHMHAGYSEPLKHSWDAFEDIEISLKRMDEAGIDKAVVLPIGMTNFVQHNRETAEIVQRYPDRLYGFAKVNQEEDKGRIAEMLDEAFGELGLRGLKLHGHPNREIMEALKRHRKPLLVDVLGQVYELRYAAENYPEVPIIIAHMGQFRSDSKAHLITLWLAKRYPNVYFDTSGVLEFEWLERAVAEGLASKMLFGSDGPVCHCGVELAKIRFLHLSPDEEELVLYRNIALLLGEEL